MSHAATAQDETEDRYYTQVDEGDVRLFTLDQLDAAFNAGLIHENTYVCLEGESTWLTLAEVAGLGEEEPVSAPVPVAAPVSVVAPVPTAFVAPHAAPVPQPRAVATPVSHAPLAAPSVMPAAPYSLAPVAVSRSVSPVTDAFDDDMDMAAMRPKRRLGKVVAGLAVVGLAAAGFGVVQSGGVRLPKLDVGKDAAQASAASLSLSNLNKSPAQPAAAPAPEAAKPEPPKVEAAAPAKSEESDSSAKKGDDRFSEEMKAALLNKDKQQTSTQKQRKAGRGAVAAKRTSAKPSKGGSAGFKSGGSAYDPLNGKL